MKKALLIMALCLISFSAHAANHRVTSYIKKNGTYVAPHYQTNPDSSLYNNYSSKPNINPYTGKLGTIDPYHPKRNRR